MQDKTTYQHRRIIKLGRNSKNRPDNSLHPRATDNICSRKGYQTSFINQKSEISERMVLLRVRKSSTLMNQDV